MKKSAKTGKNDSPEKPIKVAAASWPRLTEEDYARGGGQIFVGGFPCAPPWAKDDSNLNDGAHAETSTVTPKKKEPQTEK